MTLSDLEEEREIREEIAEATKAAPSELLPRIMHADRGINDADAELLIATAELEAELRRYVGVRIEVDLDGGRGRLAFGKLDGKWRLLVRDESGAECPLATTARGERVEVFARGDVHRLIAGAAGQLDAMIARRREALEMAREILAALRSAAR